MENSSHKYEYSVALDTDTGPARVIRMVGKNKRVLEVGAGPGSITKHLKQSGNCEVVALEIDENAIKKLSPFCKKIYKADLNGTTWPVLLENEEKFDVVVIADVLEHLYSPWNILKLLPDLLNDDGYIVVSLPHVAHNSIIACLLSEDFHYGDWGLLDKTHIRFFGLKNIQALFNDSDLSIEEAQFVIVSPEASEFSNHWAALNSETKQVLSSYPHGNIYQVVVKVVPENRAVSNIDLMSMQVGKPERIPIYTQKIKSIIKSVIPRKQYALVKKILRSLSGQGY